MNKLNHTLRKPMWLLAVTLLLAVSPVHAQWTNNQAAVNVIGQPNFTSNGPGTTATTQNFPPGVAVDPTSGKVFVADGANNRVLRYSSAAALMNGQAAEAVLGQPDFTNSGFAFTQSGMSGPNSVFVDGAGRLWVADTFVSRVLRFDNAATKANGANADGVLGQPDFTNSTPAATQSKMNLPRGVFVDGAGRLWVADGGNNRVLRFDNAAAKANGANADGVLGQTDFTNTTPASTQNGAAGPTGVFADGAGRLWVADFNNNRVLRFDNAAAKSNGTNADGVLGQPDFIHNAAATTQSGMQNPFGVFGDSDGRLYVSDRNNHRILIFNNAAGLANGAQADNVLGQPNFTSSALNNGGVSATALNGPRHVFFDPATSALFVADQGNHRTKRYKICPSLTLAALSNATAGNSYVGSVAAAPAGSYSYAVLSGSLPAGFSLNSATGALTGLTSGVGTYNFTLKALDTNGCSGTRSYTLVVACPAITLSSLPAPSLNVPYNQIASAAPAGNYSFSLTAGALPNGLSLNPSTGVVSGTPTTAGAYSFTLTATGFGGCTGSRTYSGTLGGGGCPTITLPASLPGGTVGQVYSQSVAASPAGSYSYALTSGALPPGLTLYGSVGLLYGYPTGAGTFGFTIEATGANNCKGSQAYSVTIGAAALLAKPGDFDGDGKADTALFRASLANWLVVLSGTNTLQTQAWGAPGDRAAAGDYDGDGKLDLAVFTTAGHWRIKRSSDGATVDQLWGLPTDVPVAGDYDGDGKTDLAVWRGSQGHWYIVNSSDGAVQVVQWGSSAEPYGDVAVPGDYDGDRKTDLAVFRKQDGVWYIKRSSDGTIQTQAWGLSADTPVPGDYDGDGKTDIAVWRGESSTWFIIRSGSGLLQMASWGASYAPYNDIPVPGDYDGDGKTDIAVWRPAAGMWYSLNSSDGSVRVKQHGQAGDLPVTGRP